MKTTQATRILEYLKTGAALTPLEAWTLFGCYRLGARIWDLRRQGWPIESEDVQEGRKRFARYRLVSQKRNQTSLFAAKV